MATMMQNVGAAILLAQHGWNPKTASEPLERAMARAALEAMLEPTDAMGWEALNASQFDFHKTPDEQGYLAPEKAATLKMSDRFAANPGMWMKPVIRAAIQAALDEEQR